MILFIHVSYLKKITVFYKILDSTYIKGLGERERERDAWMNSKYILLKYAFYMLLNQLLFENTYFTIYQI